MTTITTGGVAPDPPVVKGDQVVPAARPVLLEVLAYVPSDFFHCLHCERLFDVAGIGASVHREMRASYFIINHRTKYTGWGPAILDRLLAQHMTQRVSRGRRRE